MLYKDEVTKLKFYELETVQRLVNFQFVKTRDFLSKVFRLYMIGFLIPFLITITFDDKTLQNICFVMCFLTQCFLMVFEVVQMRQYGVCEYIKDFWNCIDLMQFAAFLYLFICKLATQF